MNSHTDAGCAYAIIVLAIAVAIAFAIGECGSSEAADGGCQVQ